MSNAAAPATEGPERIDVLGQVASIMDGNGRCAAARGLPRAEGHRRGVEALRRVGQHLATAAGHLRITRAGELAAEELRLAQAALGEITGATTSEDLLGAIFSSFCIGK